VAGRYDVVVIGAGLGGLTAAGLLARAGRKVLVLERNDSVGGAATTYAVGSLTVEASLHETADPHAPSEPKHGPLERLGLLDAVEWVPIDALYQVRGGPVGEAFTLPDSFAGARAALTERFAGERAGIDRLLDTMAQICRSLGTLSRGRDAFRNPREGFGALAKLGPVIRDWQRSLAEVLQNAFGDNEAAKCAVAANLPYYHDDPATMWWIHFAIAQGGYFASGGRYVRGGSQRLSEALAGAVTAAGGTILIGRTATEIRLDADGRPASVVHTDAQGGGDPVVAATRWVAGNAAPAVLAAMLGEPASRRFAAAYRGRALSMSIFSLTCGLAVRPATLGISAYSTVLLPDWIERLADYRLCRGVLRGDPAEESSPLLVMVDYSAIDSGLGGPPYPVAFVGVDRVDNWAGLDAAAYRAKRQRWAERIIAIAEQNYPGLAASVVASTFNTARSVERHLNAPDGAIYGFAPSPPRAPIWRGFERGPRTPVPGLYLASAYGGSGGFTGAILAGANAADQILAERAAS
jgi:phytoene dehydrogenase-like protein